MGAQSSSETVDMDNIWGGYDEHEGTVEKATHTESFRAGQKIPLHPYVGAKVTRSNNVGDDMEINVPVLNSDGHFATTVSKSSLQTAEEAAEVVDWDLAYTADPEPVAMIGYGWCRWCCWNPYYGLSPRRAIVVLYCTLIGISVVYILSNLMLLSAMAELCHSQEVHVYPGNSQQPVEPATIVAHSSSAHIKGNYDAATANVVPGYRFLQDTGNYAQSATTQDYAPAAAAATTEYSAAAKEAAATEYAPHSAYVEQGYTIQEKDPACNRLVQFCNVWSSILLVGLIWYGCCTFRHYRHLPARVGFWMACIFVVYYDILSCAVVYAVDAARIYGLPDWDRSGRTYEYMETHQKLSMSAASTGGYRRLDIDAAGTINTHVGTANNKARRSYTYDLEIWCSFLGFLLTLKGVLFGINLFRFRYDVIFEWGKPRPATIEGATGTLPSDGNAPDFRLRTVKSTYFSEEFEEGQ